jgi:FAD/FMN-containing dehydrogenase/Fe-S oxidoreductase
MVPPREPATSPDSFANTAAGPTLALVEQFRQAIEGEVRSDRLSRALYATDASIYEIVPDCVVIPKTVADVQATVRLCGEHGVPVTPRGAATGLTGGAVNRGVQIDLAKHLNQVQELDVDQRRVRVQPGVVLDELNAEIAAHGLYFPPDVATSSRATIGGMIANNSCGAHSVYVGRTVDHVESLEVVLADGSRVHWGPEQVADNPLVQRCEAKLREVQARYARDIEQRFPKILRRNGGYALDRLAANGRVNAETIIIGSEGTLGIVVGATLRLTPLPKRKGIVVAHFDSVLAALAAVVPILEQKPAAIELVDKLILDATKISNAFLPKRVFLEGDPDAILIIELYDEGEGGLDERLAAVVEALRTNGHGYAWPIINDAKQQGDVWEIRKAGLGLLMSIPGDQQSYAFVEDAAVDPAKLRDYIAAVMAMLREEGCKQAGYYAHASVGCIHVRPVLNLKDADDVQRLRRIADRVSSLALEFGGTMTGEHGDGIVRSEWLEKMYGPRIMHAFREIKQTFDPQNILNPNKIVDPLPMDRQLRYGAEFQQQKPLTILNFDQHGGMAGLAQMCSGVGQCRQRLVGTMCPSYMATGDERDTTRARANALRQALSNRELLDGLADPELDEVFDLCLSCKACKTECPTGTDIAKLKTEWLYHKNQREGVPRRTRLIAKSIELAAWGSRFAPLANMFMQSKVARAFMEHWYGLDQRVPPPKFAGTTFRQWFRRHQRERDAANRPAPRGPVVYFVDTWVNFYTPQVGQATVKVLEALGCEVIVPETVCCGRPLISKGLLDEAQALTHENVTLLSRYAERNIPIIGTEPSCVSAILDEWPQLDARPQADQIARNTKMIETFVDQILAAEPDALRFRADAPKLLYHGHCHQKALIGTQAAFHVLKACSHDQAEEVNSGCCGMAGSFGHEAEHYDVAKAVGEQRLFPAVRARGDAAVTISGFSCRHQIEHHTGAHVKHVIERLADALADDEVAAG